MDMVDKTNTCVEKLLLVLSSASCLNPEWKDPDSLQEVRGAMARTIIEHFSDTGEVVQPVDPGGLHACCIEALALVVQGDETEPAVAVEAVRELRLLGELDTKHGGE